MKSNIEELQKLNIDDKVVNFKHKSILQIRKMSFEERTEYYKLLRQYKYERGIPVNRGALFRKILHPVCLGLVRINGKEMKRKVHIVGDNRVLTKKPVIYASNHIGRFDAEACFDAIDKHAYLFIGDLKDLYLNPAGLLLYANGMIALETNDKIDRYIAKERAIELLKSGHSMLIYPEGAWNLTQNQIIVPLYTGAVEMAMRAGVEIIPMAIEQRENDFYVNIGKNIDFTSGTLEKKRLYTDELREVLVNLRWNIWESFDIEKRAEITTYKEYVENIMSESEFVYTAEDAFKTYFRPKNICPPNEAFSFVKDLQPNKNNAFLMKSVFKLRKLLSLFE